MGGYHEARSEAPATELTPCQDPANSTRLIWKATNENSPLNNLDVRC
jgi:hypothetical protein